ncbi:xanthine dehydrogenase family protein molybdopterin-binding subunit [Methylobacterium marchantiae]|uniref:Xanthine dehydrogenase family protein molybdopterin-binding subunit n=1 Tax=Methylobacterium marchantiae TaxID=600331 RepID=A0ABW3X394_9HYPH|nr:hypothetical protein AIGOOFII_4028 [Methylobacterium marchantiae]
MRASRREFMTWMSAGGISLSMTRLGQAQSVGFDARETLPGRARWNPAIGGLGRIDGEPKVTGAKLYASDFRAADMPGWPDKTAHALLVRAPDASHVYLGLDLARLSGAMKPTLVVTASDIATIGLQVPDFYAGDLFCPVGRTPFYLGQPVAMLIFDGFDAYDQARVAVRDGTFVRFGEETGPIEAENYGAFRFTRVAGPTPESPDLYSPVLAGWVKPGRVQHSPLPVWEPYARETSDPYGKAARYGETIRAGLAGANADLLVLDRHFETQSVDPMFLEPEAGLAWHDGRTGTLELVLGVQSPFDASEAIAFLLAKAKAPFKPKRIKADFAYMGGGFGGRDHTPFMLYVTLAGLFFTGRPVRLAHDRFQQFQGGIKRHAFKMHSRIGVDRRTARITAFAADHVLDGGGLANFSPNVATVAATAAIGIYDIPKVDITTVALHSRGVTAGSMRGYGTVQTLTALETLVDEVAAALPLDPIAFRRRNALPPDGRTMTGNRYTVSVRTMEILDKLETHPIWAARAAEKARPRREGILVGTGVAVATKDYGTGADCSLGRVEIDAEGGISITSDQPEMGNGMGTALASRVAAHLGGMAEEISLARVGVFGELALVTSGNSYTMDQKTQDAAERNSRWVPAISAATAASNGAHVGTHSTSEAARVVFRFGLWPAALALWSIAPADHRAEQWAQATWRDGNLHFADLPPLSLKALAAKAHASRLVTGATTHCFSRWAWAKATFPVQGHRYAAEIDALAIRRGGGPFERVARVAVSFPPTGNNRIGTTYGAACGTLVRVEIERTSGAITIARAYTILECGNALVPEVVKGQAQGGFAMGVGYALLETLPPFEDGPGNGRWNLGQYVVARGSDLPLHDFEVEMLPPLTPDEAPKGIAEVVMIPVVPALLNAIFDATGHRFQSLPVSPSMLKGALA